MERLVTLPLAVMLLGLPAGASDRIAAAPARSRTLTFEQRLEAQRAIERVYYAHQIGATRAFDEAVPREILERKIRTYLRQSLALERIWRSPITAEALRAESDRVGRQTRMPDRLKELYAALGGDRFLIQECLVRPVLADRLSRNLFAWDQRMHRAIREEAEALRAGLASGHIDPRAFHTARRVVETASGEDDLSAAALLREEGEAFTVRAPLERTGRSVRMAVYEFPKRSWDDWWSETERTLDERQVSAVAVDAGPSLLEGDCLPDNVWESGALVPFPTPRQRHSAVWTGSHMLVWGGVHFEDEVRSGFRYEPATDAYTPISMVNAPAAASNHTAVWTGSVMVIWGGSASGTPAVATGARYDPVTDTWTPTATADAPTARLAHTALWTGSRMLVWGGFGFTFNSEMNTGGLYDPVTDSWTATSTVGAAARRQSHRAVWSGSLMIVWGGHGPSGFILSGGRYDPKTDTWLPMSTTNASPARSGFTMVWAGDRAIVWGGSAGGPNLQTGARYDPVSDFWTPTATMGAPEGRSNHVAISTGGAMIVWGGIANSVTATGGRYDPVANTWTSTTALNAPQARMYHSAVWTGSTMIIWGGWNELVQQELRSAGRYNPAADIWAQSLPPPYPSARTGHTAVWTGNVMVIWGGGSASGSRYDPALDAWSPTSTFFAPIARSQHTAVWTGEQMVVWGGMGAGPTGGRYNPIADTWAPTTTVGAPALRWEHTAVWTGDRMVVWGGFDSGTSLDSGGRYDPINDTWTPTTAAGAPEPRWGHTAVWTGQEMIVWGGTTGSMLATGGRYDVGADLWRLPPAVSGAPVARAYHTAVWTGGTMIVWGGYHEENSFRQYPAAGARYSPATDTWTPVTTAGSPQARGNHTAIWTGSRMIVWGGVICDSGASCGYGSFTFGTGGRYDPGQDAWQPLATSGAPKESFDHTAVWTGSSMIVWGGQSCDLNGACPLLDTGGTYRIDAAPDADGDTRRSSCDCNDADGSVWATPGEVQSLDIAADDATLTWPAPSLPGAAMVVYDLLRSPDPCNFDTGAICVEADDGGDTAAVDGAAPPPGEAFYYLVRAQNACPVGLGPLGSNSNGTPRAGRDCP